MTQGSGLKFAVKLISQGKPEASLFKTKAKEKVSSFWINSYL